MSSEHRSPRAVFCSATVVGEEALGEDIQQLLQPIVSYSVQYNQQYHHTFYIPTHFQYLRGGGDDGRGCQLYNIVMMYSESILPHSFRIYTEGLYCSRIHCLEVNARV